MSFRQNATMTKKRLKLFTLKFKLNFKFMQFKNPKFKLKFINARISKFNVIDHQILREKFLDLF